MVARFHAKGICIPGHAFSPPAIFELLLGATSSSIFSMGRCDYEAFVTGPVSSKADCACRKKPPDEHFIEMENCTDYGFQ